MLKKYKYNCKCGNSWTDYDNELQGSDIFTRPECTECETALDNTHSVEVITDPETIGRAVMLGELSHYLTFRTTYSAAPNGASRWFPEDEWVTASEFVDLHYFHDEDDGVYSVTMYAIKDRQTLTTPENELCLFTTGAMPPRTYVTKKSNQKQNKPTEKMSKTIETIEGHLVYVSKETVGATDLNGVRYFLDQFVMPSLELQEAVLKQFGRPGLGKSEEKPTKLNDQNQAVLYALLDLGACDEALNGGEPIGADWSQLKKTIRELGEAFPEARKEYDVDGEEPTPPKRFNHMMDIAFALVTEEEDPLKLDGATIREAIIQRLSGLTDSELAGDCVGYCDTYEED